MAEGQADTFVVAVPKSGLDGRGADIRTFLQWWEWRPVPRRARQVAIDFRDVQFIEPWSLAMFACHALYAKATTSLPVDVLLDPGNPANVYCEGMGLGHVVATGTSTLEWDESAQNTGLHVIRDHGDVKRFSDSASRLGKGPNDDTMDALKYAMAELGRNIVQHAQSPVGGVAIAQFFPEREAIQIAVCDCGCGVFDSLRGSYPELANDLEALKLSLLPHVSSAFRPGIYTSGENAGLGLFFSKEICWRAGGSFWIASRKAMIGVTDEDASGHTRIYRAINPWNGTLVVLDFPSKGVENFSGILQVCNQLARDARSNSGSAGLDFLAAMPETEGYRVIRIKEIAEDVQAAARIREEQIMPAVRGGQYLVLDFADIRFVTQSFAHALLSEVFKIPGSLVRLSFLHCTRSSEEAIRAVAAYSASYFTGQ